MSNEESVLTLTGSVAMEHMAFDRIRYTATYNARKWLESSGKTYADENRD